MIEVVKGGNAGLMQGLLDRMNIGGAAQVRLYAGTRPPAASSTAAPLVALVLLADLAGTIDPANGDLILDTGSDTTVLIGSAPTWARIQNGGGEHLFDCDARLSTSPDLGQEIVLIAPAGFYTGALLRIQSGTFSARP